ncbi:aryl-alcohol dehydrogenase-like predicted oxidoreductase [Deinococcus sp. HSC-46F16]|uniref:aldo/keto reductase n=1 Tax=Deinococcus sp. HSC-46F16 TaxID=2910968 RepID=UPI0020A015EA|nr:aldo/keto reductase [Deinococcus sp. HSC-46F16]MCP2013766.1 aryl-alcohol dehydrogenase-like predicted oxidoreductase [Deinococcus sp. HSC-46F16]
MEQREFGKTGFRVSVLGLGAGQVGAESLDDREAGRLLHRALDLGVTLIDTARGYGLSEERIGRHLAGRRDGFVLSTKGGYGVEGMEDWTPGAIRHGIERALRTMRTDRIDIFHLHSCPLDTLRRDDLLAELDRAREAGLIGVAAYSGENEALAWAADSGRFGSLETSVNVTDQWSLRHVLPGAAARGLGVIAKRPIANAAWQFTERPVGQYAEVYWERLGALNLDPGGLEWTEFALRFSAFAPGVGSAIVGTARVENLERNAAIVERGPLPAELLAQIEAAWTEHGGEWGGEV